jgi:PTS system nitrogen regulatory IIA component
MRLSTAIRKECLRAKAGCTDKEQTLREVADLAKKCPVLDAVPAATILQGFQDRESLSSTGIGDGIAVPHCRIPDVGEFIVGMITLAEAIDFDSIDGKKVSIIAFIVGPESDTVDHPRILSGLSLRLSQPDVRRKLLSATSSQDLLEGLEFPVSHKNGVELSVEKRLVYVIVQEKDVFYRVLEAIESIDGAMPIVLESSNASQHLTRLPVFASFLSDDPGQFSRVIFATLPKRLTNEALRRIEAVTGPLNDRRDIAVIVHDVFLMAGKLGV